MRGNILGQSGTSVNNSLFPIYQQMVEPYKKYGVWVKSNDKIKNLYFQNDLIIQKKEIKLNAFIKNYDTANYQNIAIENDIYRILKTSDSSTNIKLYKYNLKENTCTEIPFPISAKSAIAINVKTDIYFFIRGNDINDGRVYKYNTKNSIFTKLLENVTDYCYYAQYSNLLAVVGTNIYYLYNLRTFKYDIINNIFTSISSLGDIEIDNFAISTNDKEITVFGVVSYLDDEYTRVYKYNIDSDTYTEINGNQTRYKSIAKISNMIYLYAVPKYEDGNYLHAIMKYDAEKNIFYKYSFFDTEIEKILAVKNKLYAFYNLGQDIYLLDSKIQNKGDGLYIVTNNDMLSKNMDMESILDVKKLVNGEEQEVEAYVGDGQSWNLLN